MAPRKPPGLSADIHLNLTVIERQSISMELKADVYDRRCPAPVRRFLPALIDLVWTGKINPGKVFDLELPLAEVAEAYRAMDERRAIKALLRP